MNWQRFNSRDDASLAAAEYLANAIHRAVADHRQAHIALSGGSTPRQCYRYLSTMAVNWPSTSVTLTDERCVPGDHADSNAKMVRDCLTGSAAEASLHDSADLSPSAQSPFDVVLLGMGEDGHFASLFPDAHNLADGLDVTVAPAVLRVETAASPYPRLSLNLAALLRAECILLLVFGSAKQQVLEQAWSDPQRYPVGALLVHAGAKLQILYAE